MENKRTEEEKLTQAPIMVTLGGKGYNIAPLVMKYSREWRKNALPLITYLVEYARKNDEQGLDAIGEFFTTKTDEIIESFFEYARELNREEIEGIALDGEIITAFMEVFHAFVSPLSKAAKKTPPKKASPRKIGRSL